MTSQTSHSEARLEYSQTDLLTNGEYAEPLIAGGVRCHGGFDADGNYCSPRVFHRQPAITAWQQNLLSTGHDLIQVSSELIPPQYPSIDQAVLLCRNGLREPIVRALTVISVVEGFGAIIRDVKVPDLESVFVEPIQGTALSHLRGGALRGPRTRRSGLGRRGGS